MNALVEVERVGAVAVLGMNAPQKRNALDLPLAGALGDALTRIQEDGSVRAVVLTGGDHFCAGGDLSALDQGPLEMRRTMQHSHRIVKAIISGPAPVIAAVEGNAYGAGFSVAMACDFVVADENTVFCAAFSCFGLMPDYGLCWTLPQRVGIGTAREIGAAGARAEARGSPVCGGDGSRLRD
jgi:enoyl-CoA hydratase/carnithine racemase